MSDELDRDLQDWFKRSAEALPEQPFTLTVLEPVWRRELRLHLQRYAALLVAFFSFCLLLPELVALANTLVALPLTITDAGSGQWPVLLVVALGFAYLVGLRRARR